MINIPGYSTKNKIYESENSIIFRGRQKDERFPVILKILAQRYPSSRRLCRFKREYEITKKLSHLKGVITTHDLYEIEDRAIIILEDFGGISIDKILQENIITIPTFISAAIKIVESLIQIHHENIIHKDINPSNIVWNYKSNILKIIDFGISTELSQEMPTALNPEQLEGTLAYISPEQTGKTNRSLDYRTDFYSLGITFYEMLTGVLPFYSDNRSELIHMQITREPIPPQRIKRTTPPKLSEIILKLMAKKVEERYQSGEGIKRDLEKCLAGLNAPHITFEIGADDISDKFRIPQKLYGRDNEINELLTAVDDVKQGAPQFFTISGSPGIGKTSVVNEIHKSIIQQRAYFISGKYDQLKRNIPYSGIKQAFGELMEHILIEPETQIQRWKQRILQNLGESGKVIIDMIPQLELIIGKQPDVAQLAPQESQNRLNYFFQKFVATFTSPNSPLIIFLDDMQWADIASLNLLRFIIHNRETANILFIGAYRDNGVDAAHPLSAFLKDVENSHIQLQNIQINPLKYDHIYQLIQDTLKSDKHITEELTQICVDKTRGNPFFLLQFLKSLYDDNLITFDYDFKQWKCDLKQTKVLDITDNVVDLLVKKIRKLSPQTQSALQVAACIGGKFDLEILSVAYEHSLWETASHLWQAMKENLISPLDNSYKFLSKQVKLEDSEVEIAYKFLHDRIQQAVYSTIDESLRKEKHLQIGRLLLANLETSEESEKLTDDKIFDIVNQLNSGAELITSVEEKDTLAELNNTAGKKAKSSAAFDLAFDYFSVGLNFLTEDCWQKNYQLSLQLYSEAAECALLVGNGEQFQTYSDIVLENAIDILDTIKIYMLKIDFNVIAFLDYEKAIEIGIDFLKSLGVSLKRHPTEEEVKSALEDISNLLQTNGDEMLQNLPLMTDPKIIAAANILSAMFWTTYRSGSLIFQMCGITSVQLSLKYGIVPESAFGFIWSGITFCLYDDFEPAIKLADFGVELSRRLAPKNLRPKMEQLYYYMIFRFRGHCKKSIEKLHELLQIAMENGEFLDAIAMSHGITCLMFSAGMELEKVKEHTFAYYQKSLELNFRSIAGMFAVELQKFQNLMEETETPWILSGEFFDINQLMPILEEKEDFFSIASLKNSTMFLAFHFEKYQIAYESAQYCYPYAKNNLAPDHMYFIYAFTCLALYPDVESDKQKELLEQIEILEQKLKRWAEQSPVTYLHEYCLIKAEKANVFGENWEAIEYYDKAINAARENKFIHRVALGNELAGKFYLSRNKPKVAKIYLKEAHYNYTLWGAMAKAKHLEKKYPDLLKKQKTHSATPTKSSTDETSVTDLDLNNVLQASQAISSEINLERLLKKIMKIVIENAGAQKGFLLLETDNHWFIEAESDVDKEDIPVLQSIPMEESQELSCGVVNYVSRKKEPVVLGDASAEGIFMADPYIQAKQPKSLLCMPLINQGKLNGILYLENNLLTDVFMEDRLQLLNLLSSQLAISVENSMLYTKLEKSRKRLYTFLEAVPVGIFVVDKFGKPFYANEKASWMLNQGKEEPITPENITGIYADYAAQKFPEIYQVYIAGTNRVYPSKRQPIVRALNGETATVEDMELHIGDQIILLEVWGTPVFDEKGDVAYAIAAFQDITKRKQVERLLDRYSKNLEKEVEKRTAELADKNEQLIQLNRDKSEILSIVAHDLKNPLAALQGFADIISRHIKDYPETKLMQCSQNIVTNAKRMFNIINKMLDVNAIEEGKIIFRKEKQDVRIIVGFLVDGYKNQASDKRITIKFDIPDEPCHVLSDKEVLTQIFDNLISNAIKYSPFDEQIVINVYRKADKIHFEVKDNGQGLSDNDQKKLFKKFARLSPKPTNKEHSTGLGLYIVKKLLDGINGKIWCESEPGNGTTFSVELSAYDFSEPA